MERKPHELENFTVGLWLEMCRALTDITRTKQGSVRAPSYIYYQLCSVYNQRRRFYHDLNHIDRNVGEWLKHHEQGRFQDPYAVLWAQAYHDLDPQSEKESVRLAQADWRTIGWSDFSFSFKHMTMLIAVSDHQSIVVHPDARLSCDIDLVSLALPRDQFDRNTQRLLWELPKAAKPAADRAQKRRFWQDAAEFMARLLERDSIYQTEYYQHLEKTARFNAESLVRNVTRNLDQLLPALV